MFFIGKTDILLPRIALLRCVGLTFANVDYESMVTRFNQKKSAGRSAHTAVVTPLNNELLRLIGNPKDENDLKERVFNLHPYRHCKKASLPMGHSCRNLFYF